MADNQPTTDQWLFAGHLLISNVDHYQWTSGEDLSKKHRYTDDAEQMCAHVFSIGHHKAALTVPITETLEIRSGNFTNLRKTCLRCRTAFEMCAVAAARTLSRWQHDGDRKPGKICALIKRRAAMLACCTQACQMRAAKGSIDVCDLCNSFEEQFHVFTRVKSLLATCIPCHENLINLTQEARLDLIDRRISDLAQVARCLYAPLDIWRLIYHKVKTLALTDADDSDVIGEQLALYRDI